MFRDLLNIHEMFCKHGTADPLLDTFRLIDILSNGRLGNIDMALLENEKVDLDHVAQRRKGGQPLEYIIGMTPFKGLMFSCSEDTLIPRKETELLVDVALNFIKEKQKSEKNLTIVDVGTGCGNVAASLASSSRNTRILATDISPQAVEIARQNVSKLGLEERVFLFCGDLFSPFEGSGHEGSIDLIVCNPPYIPTNSLRKLSPEIIDHEPTVALDAGPFGIDIFRRLVNGSVSMLKPEGILVFEVGVGQEKLVARLLERNGVYEDIRYFHICEQVRVISARKKKTSRSGSML